LKLRNSVAGVLVLKEGLTMQTLWGDIRYALRVLRQSPVFTLTAILTLALGIGGTTGIFSLIHAVMLRSLPVADPASCVEGGPQENWGLFSFPLFERPKAAAPEFEQVAAFQAMAAQFSVRRATTERVARPMRGEFVTGNYFSTFGIGSFAGRVFSSKDDHASAAPVAVLSYRAWRGSYGGDPSVIGSSFVIEGRPFTIIGIAPPGFFGETLRSDPPDLWLPLQQEPLVNGENSLLHQSIGAWLRTMGRLKPGATVAGISARLTGVMRQWLKYDSGFPAVLMPDIERSLPKQNIRLVPAGGGVATMKANYGSSLDILLTVCCLVLLIACANVANLLLARGMARRTQTSLRIALGASRARLIRQSLTESVLLSLGGGLAGLIVADQAGRLILALAFHSAHFLPIDTSPSLPVLSFAFALSLVTGMLFGPAPAWFATHVDPVEALRGANRSTRDSSSLPQRVFLIWSDLVKVSRTPRRNAIRKSS
jgi:predicted permease